MLCFAVVIYLYMYVCEIKLTCYSLFKGLFSECNHILKYSD